jgi:hypothetical protein
MNATRAVDLAADLPRRHRRAFRAPRGGPGVAADGGVGAGRQPNGWTGACADWLEHLLAQEALDGHL